MKVHAVARKQLQQFLGFTNFFRSFIWNYRKVVAPLTSLTSTLQAFYWTTKAEAVFVWLRVRLSVCSECPVLTPVNSEIMSSLFLCCRSGDVGWRNQSSRLFSGLTTRTSLTTVKPSYWTCGKCNGRSSWDILTSLSPTDLVWNMKPDALSRHFSPEPSNLNPSPILSTSCIVGTASWLVEEKVQSAKFTDQGPPETPRNWLFVSLFQHSSVGPPIQTYLSPVPCSNPLFPAAEALVALHATGHQALLLRVLCALMKWPQIHLWPPAPLPVPHCPWLHIAVDFVTDLPHCDGNTTILIVADCFSKAVYFIPLPKLTSTAETGALLLRHIFRLHRFPRDIVSDWGAPVQLSSLEGVL